MPMPSTDPGPMPVMPKPVMPRPTGRWSTVLSWKGSRSTGSSTSGCSVFQTVQVLGPSKDVSTRYRVKVASAVTNAEAALRWLGGHPPDLDEVRQVYLPLSRLLSLYVGSSGDLHRAQEDFLRRPQPPRTPFVIGLAGSVITLGPKWASIIWFSSAVVGALQYAWNLRTLWILPDPPHGIADALQRLLQDDALCEQLSARGRVRAQQFTWERTATATWQVLEETAAA